MKTIKYLLAAALFSASALAQSGYSTTTASLASVCYNNGSVQASWINTNPTSPTLPNLNGAPFAQSVPSAIDSSGNFTLRLADVNVVVPNSPNLSYWKITACAKGGSQPACYSANVPATGSTFNASSYFSGATSACTGGSTYFPGTPTVTVTGAPSGAGQVPTSTGTATATWQASSGGFTAGGDLSGSSTSQQVKGINGVPLCTGYTPTNGLVVEYVTTSSPNPCYQPGGLAPPLQITSYPAAVSDGGTAFAAALTRYTDNQPQAGSVNAGTSARGYLAFNAAASLPQYAEQTVELPPFWTGTTLYLDFYSAATTGNVTWEVESACVAANQVVGSPTWSSPVTVTTSVSGTTGGAVTTAAITIASNGVNGCPSSSATLPSAMSYRVFRSASDTAAGNANLTAAVVVIGRSQ
ncbi:hypothetical protein [Silvimonas sp.]|uniref:hypothetical protein n=1 Tax=Silvimonas sp. TaxID=2650811 RepID=UPI00284B73B2|nr:hypothetical protein [Silvimonas sp.]MDR3426093.1 hypothetical protein [Silvimonas sp.]